MLKKIVCTALLGVCALAQAQPYLLTATYTGFADIETGVFDPARVEKLQVYFDDRNHDGTITVDEVQEFKFGTGIHLTRERLAMDRCGMKEYETWCLSRFSYTADGALSYYAGNGVRDFDASSGTEVVGGYSYYRYFQYSGEGGGWVRGIRWTADTQTAVSVSAVPETATYAMLGAGLALLGALRRRGR
ncbi:EF-hand domain-containing protein [Pseudoduganella armeniaca]|uniref:EF-hand domain-containing protein n=1 Tax=Pseudoduganella armeniaca TaxID=2072590 RepID=UPI001E4A5271|nr:EF-hand domain-containing protein [Pseudoduganella armeniaca]